MTQIKDDLICFKCKHYIEFEGCKAFPDGNIPDKIIRSNKHSEPLKWQTNKIVFEEKDDFSDL